MINGKFNCIIDAFWGSSGKGKTSAWLADRFNTIYVSSSNFPNAGHTAAFSDGTKFIAKAIPTAAILKKVSGFGMQCFISPGSGFNLVQLTKEWKEAGMPSIFIHSRASIVTDEHKKREAAGSESTMHIASTMQGTAAALVDKILRKPDVCLAEAGLQQFISQASAIDVLGGDKPCLPEFLEKVQVVQAHEFRNLTHAIINNGHTWLHEGSQGYALSIDHGSHYPYCTSRNCNVQSAMDQMAIPAPMLGDVYLNLRTYPIRVGNVIQDGEQKGYSGDFYPDCREYTWEEVATKAGMPPDEAQKLAERERTTVTKRIRRVTNFSFVGLRDAVQTNGATKLVVNFIQYINWEDRGIKGGMEAFQKLSPKSRAFIDRIQEEAGVPVVLIGTGPLHDEMISLL
jgi:adenylosuccinate synthase